MKKKISIIIAVIVIIALIAAAAIFHYLSNRTHFNEGYVNGNTAGNLYNGGLFCEYDGTVYFFQPVRRREAVFDVSGRKQSGQAL